MYVLMREREKMQSSKVPPACEPKPENHKYAQTTVYYVKATIPPTIFYYLLHDCVTCDFW